MENLFKKKCIVYVAWRGPTCLYVGMSKVGMRRPLTNKILDGVREEITKLDVHDCKTPGEALKLERKLFRELKPILAKRPGPGRPKEVDTEIIWLRLPISIAKLIRSNAKSQDQTMTRVMRQIIEGYYERVEVK